MRLVPSRARLAGLGLLIAAVTIIALSILVISDLDREVLVHEEVSTAQNMSGPGGMGYGPERHDANGFPDASPATPTTCSAAV